MRTLYILIVLLAGYSCSVESNELKTLDLQTLNKGRTVALYDNYGKHFDHYRAVFLENTDSCSVLGVQQVLSLGSKVYTLIKNKIRSHYLSTGRMDGDFHFSNENKLITAFDIDTLTLRLYAVEAHSSRLICFNTLGTTLFDIPLDSQYEYDQVVVLDADHLLLVAKSLPVPVTFIVDLNNRQMISLDKPGNNSFTPNALQLKQIKSPLFLWSKSEKGVYGKYLLNDTIYQYSKNGKEPVYRVRLGKDGLTYKNRTDLFKKNKQLTLSRFKQLSSNRWLLRYRNVTWTVFQICDSLMMPYTYPPSGLPFVWCCKDDSIFDIGMGHRVFIDEVGRKLFTINRYQTVGGTVMMQEKLPKYLRDHPQKSELLLCYFALR